jgi:hypothetical protein
MIKQWYNRHGKLIWWAVVAGVPIGYLGLLTKTPWLWWLGIVLALPLFVVVLPICLFLLTAMVTWPFWYPFYWLIITINGVPFEQGDMVKILWGRHRGKVVRVYDIWNQRDEVRVELGEKEKEDYTDVFSFISVKKQRIANEEVENDSGDN